MTTNLIGRLTMNQIAICCWMFSLACLLREATADDAKEIRQLIPSATAMQRADMEKLATAEAPKYEDFEDKSFTLQILWMKTSKDLTAEQREEFNMFSETPKPSDLMNEIYRVRKIGRLVIPLGPVTAIHAERITDFTCEVDGKTASGTVKFKVPNLYEGKVDYIAQRTDDEWHIAEFLMPAYKIHIVRGDDGKWVEQK